MSVPLVCPKCRRGDIIIEMHLEKFALAEVRVSKKQRPKIKSQEKEEVKTINLSCTGGCFIGGFNSETALAKKLEKLAKRPLVRKKNMMVSRIIRHEKC